MSVLVVMVSSSGRQSVPRRGERTPMIGVRDVDEGPSPSGAPVRPPVQLAGAQQFAADRLTPVDLLAGAVGQTAVNKLHEPASDNGGVDAEVAVAGEVEGQGGTDGTDAELQGGTVRD